MAKIGNFVGRGFHGFTEEEFEYVKGIVANVMDKHGYKGTITTEYSGVSNSVRIEFAEPIVKRNRRGELINIKGFCAMLTKENGELEIDWKNKIYEPFEGFSYTIKVLTNGSRIRYRGRNNDPLESGYDYNTELKELPIEQHLEIVFSHLD